MNDLYTLKNNRGDRVDISIVIPACNEAERIEPFLDELLSFLKQLPYSYEIIVAEDGSTDGTCKIVNGYSQKHSSIRLIHRDQRLGKGGGLKSGFRSSHGEIIFFMDADGGYQPSEIPRFIEALKNGDVAIGVRTHIAESSPLGRRLASVLFNYLFKVLFVTNIHDTQAGFKALSRKALQAVLADLNSTGFEIDIEIIVKARMKGYEIIEVPISYRYIQGSSVNIFRDGLMMGLSLVKLRLHRLY